MNKAFVDKWESQVKKGVLSFIILNLLESRKMYGYEMIEYVSASLSIEIAEGTLYPLLNKLRTAGLLESEWIEQETGMPRKYYVLTAEGQSTLSEMASYWRDLVKTIKSITK